MTYAELLQTVKAKLPSRTAITANWIQMRYRVLQMEARKCVQELQAEGLVGREWDTKLGGYPVVK